MKFVTTYRISSETQKELKLLAVKLDVNMSDLFDILIQNYKEAEKNDRKNEKI